MPPANPTDLLAQRHKTYRDTLDRHKRATAKRQQAEQGVAAAEAALHVAEDKDREALGEALIDERKRPARKSAAARAALDSAKRELEALQYAEQRAAAKVDKLPERYRDEWSAQASRDVPAAQRNLAAAAHQLAAARDELATEASLAAYIEHGASYSAPIGEGLHLPQGDGTMLVVAFDRFITALLAEAENAADGRHRLPAGATLPNYTKPGFWRRERVHEAEAS